MARLSLSVCLHYAATLEIPDMIGSVYEKQFKLSRPDVSISEKAEHPRSGKFEENPGKDPSLCHIRLVG